MNVRNCIAHQWLLTLLPNKSALVPPSARLGQPLFLANAEKTTRCKIQNCIGRRGRRAPRVGGRQRAGAEYGSRRRRPPTPAPEKPVSPSQWSDGRTPKGGRGRTGGRLSYAFDEYVVTGRARPCVFRRRVSFWDKSTTLNYGCCYDLLWLNITYYGSIGCTAKFL